MRNESISTIKQQVQDHTSEAVKHNGVNGVNGHWDVREMNSDVKCDQPGNGRSVTSTRRSKDLLNCGKKLDVIPEGHENGVAVKRDAVVLLEPIDHVQFNGTTRLSQNKCKKVADSKVSNVKSKVLNGDCCKPAKIMRRSLSAELKVVNGGSRTTNGVKSVSGTVVVLNSPKKSARIAQRKSVMVKSSNGSLHIDETAKCLLNGKFAQPVVMLERTPTQKKCAKNIPSSIQNLTPAKVTKLLTSTKFVKKSDLIVKPARPPGTVGTSARSGRFIVRPSRFFD